MKKISPLLSILALYLMLFACEDADFMSKDSDAEAISGKGGSTARFTISSGYLYTVDNRTLKLFNLSNPQNPTHETDIQVGRGIETIFPYQNHLYLGSQFGMYIYDISTPSQPSFVSDYQHIVSCDPVVVEDNYAYITLRSVDNRCGRFTNELHIIDISNLSSPKQVRTYQMTSPKGLGIDGNKLFICDNGLKVFDATDVQNLQQINHFQIEANDVIPYYGKLIVTASDGIYQYDYTGTSMNLLSVIKIEE